ncbi:MAG: hypothetical protein WA886_08100, partial [Candidatus Acidiferrales bacterium]
GWELGSKDSVDNTGKLSAAFTGFAKVIFFLLDQDWFSHQRNRSRAIWNFTVRFTASGSQPSLFR